jgi:CRP-like cAMP-binding protein
MASLLTLTYSSPTRNLKKGEVLVTQGERGGDLYVLETGRLTVERDGVTIATVDQPNSTVGEMSVLLGTHNSATVRADKDSTVRVVKDAIRILEKQPALALSLATLVSQRLDATSALVVELTREHAGKSTEQGLLKRIFSALVSAPAEPPPQTPKSHE